MKKACCKGVYWLHELPVSTKYILFPLKSSWKLQENNFTRGICSSAYENSENLRRNVEKSARSCGFRDKAIKLQLRFRSSCNRFGHELFPETFIQLCRFHFTTVLKIKWQICSAKPFMNTKSSKNLESYKRLFVFRMEPISRNASHEEDYHIKFPCTCSI